MAEPAVRYLPDRGKAGTEGDAEYTALTVRVKNPRAVPLVITPAGTSVSNVIAAQSQPSDLSWGNLTCGQADDFRVDCELCRHWGLSRRTGAKQNCAGGVEERRGRSRFFAGAKQNGVGAKQNGGGEEEGVSWG
ncbi:hypothetical protein Bbelb_310390 [Branchiostoma belcheri]|nr:hypothetical protein Bbelb_310390 [Branchiostoma belcheri]